jgi:hypothetical protein
MALIITPPEHRKTKEERGEQSRLFHLQLKKLTNPTIKEFQDELNRSLARSMQTAITATPFVLKQSAWEKMRDAAFSDPLEKYSTHGTVVTTYANLVSVETMNQQATAALAKNTLTGTASANSFASMAKQQSYNSAKGLNKRLFPGLALIKKFEKKEAKKKAEKKLRKQEHHKEMLIDVQVEALRRFEAEKQAKATQPQAGEVGDIGALGAVVMDDTKNQTTDGDIYPLREAEFELLEIDCSLPLKEVYELVIATGNKVWHKQRQAKGATPEFINKDSFDSQFYKDYCKEREIPRKRGAPLKPK